MICRFCSQWNEREPGRCRFCGNRLEGDRDETGEGALGSGQRVTLPAALASQPEERTFSPVAGISLSSLSQYARLVGPVVGIVGLGLVLVLLRLCVS